MLNPKIILIQIKKKNRKIHINLYKKEIQIEFSKPFN